MSLWKNGRFVEDDWRVVEDEEPLPETDKAIVSLARWRAEREALAGRNAPLGLLIPPGSDWGDIVEDLPRFPVIAVGDPNTLALGDALFVLGYPEAGSLGTRASITLTRGIVSGFERRGPTLLIKTDADIAAGNSGGPVLNEKHELIGLATETISEEFGNSQVGYIWPLWLVPAEWWAIVDSGR